VLLLAVLLACATVPAGAPRGDFAPRDLQGTWTTATVTPLERPDELAQKAFLTEAEAAEYERTWLEKFQKNFPADDLLLAPDLDYLIMDRMAVVADRRTSLITDSADGRLPPLLPAAQARADAQPKQTRDDPELLGLAERCLMETSFGSSTSSPPLVPSPFGQNFYQIVQTPTHVVIYSELVHDARIIRIGGTHLRPACSCGWAIRSAAGRGTHWSSTRRTSATRPASVPRDHSSMSSSASRASAR